MSNGGAQWASPAFSLPAIIIDLAASVTAASLRQWSCCLRTNPTLTIAPDHRRPSASRRAHVIPDMESMMNTDEVSDLVLKIRAMASRLRDLGMDDDDLIGVLSRGGGKGLELSPKGTLIILDTGRSVRLTPMEKTLYKLLLRYEDGIKAEDLWKYYDELVRIYGGMSRYDDPDDIAAAVDNLCDDSRITLYTNLSRIKRKITDAGGASAARRYAILRGRDNAYRIAAPRNLIKGSL